MIYFIVNWFSLCVGQLVLIKYYLLLYFSGRAVCRKHELTQFELEVASQDLISKKQQREELATGVCSTYVFLVCAQILSVICKLL